LLFRAPVFAPGAVGSHGVSGVERCPVWLPVVVLDPLGCVCVVPRVEPVLCAIAGAASASASAAPLNTVVSAFLFMYRFPCLLFGPRLPVQCERREQTFGGS
jgi:hypothetical protein